MRGEPELGEDGQGKSPPHKKPSASSLKVAGGGGGAAAEPVGPRLPPARPVLTGPPLLGAYMPRGSGGARPTGGSALPKPLLPRGCPPGQGRSPPRLAGRYGGRRRSRLVLGGGGGGGGSAAAAGGRDRSRGRRERERSGCARGGGRWQQVSRRPPSPGSHLPPPRDRRGCPGGTVGRSAGEGCGDGGWGEPGGGGRTGRVSSRLAATSGLAASPGGREGGRGTGSPPSRNRPASPGTGAGERKGQTTHAAFPFPLSSISRRENPWQNGTDSLSGQCPSLTPLEECGCTHSLPPVSSIRLLAKLVDTGQLPTMVPPIRCRTASGSPSVTGRGVTLNKAPGGSSILQLSPGPVLKHQLIPQHWFRARQTGGMGGGSRKGERYSKGRGETGRGPAGAPLSLDGAQSAPK